MDVLEGCLKPSAGTVRVLGHDPFTQRPDRRDAAGGRVLPGADGHRDDQGLAPVHGSLAEAVRIIHRDGRYIAPEPATEAVAPLSAR